MSRLPVLFFTVALAPALQAQWAECEKYPVLPSPVDPVAVNASGTGVGVYAIPSANGSRSVRFGATSFVYLDAPAGSPYNGVTRVRGIDAQNVAYGSSQIDALHSDATLWTTAAPQLVSSLVTSGASLDLHEAIGAFPSGAIVGTARLPGWTTVERGFYLKAGVLTEIFDANLMSTAIPLGLGLVGGNEVVVGYGLVGSTNHAWTWTGGVFTMLALPAVPNASSAAQAINSAGTVCGWYSTTPDPFTTPAYPRAARWQNGVFADLHNVAGQSTELLAINTVGDAVGYSNSGVDSAVLWRNGQGIFLQQIVPLDTQIFLERAVSITDDGSIYGTNFASDGFRLKLCAGSYKKLGSGCGGTLPAPKLDPGAGCPDAGKTMSLKIAGGLPNAGGLLLLGSGNGPLAFKPSCILGVAPLLPVSLPIAVSAAGTLTLAGTLPTTLPPATLYLQVLLADPLAAGGGAATNVLRMDVQ